MATKDIAPSTPRAIEGNGSLWHKCCFALDQQIDGRSIMAKSLLVLGAFLIWAVSTDGAVSQSAQGWADCSTRDVNAVTLIENHGAAADVPAERLFGATLVVFEARKACNEGRFSEARALYELVLTLGPVHGQVVQE